MAVLYLFLLMKTIEDLVDDSIVSATNTLRHQNSDDE